MMDSQKIQYDIAVARLIDIFPELTNKLDKYHKRWAGEFPGLHNTMGDVFDPFMVKALKERDSSGKLDKIFDFIEELVCSEHEYISNVGVVTVCERIVFEGPKVYRYALTLAHERTRYHMQLLIDFFYPEEKEFNPGPRPPKRPGLRRFK